ncbi:MAG: lysophospholipid acyltransferase family protein [bacterium]
MRKNEDSNITQSLSRLAKKGIRERIERLEINTLPDSEYDQFGFSKRHLLTAAPFVEFFYRYWHRVEVFGIENIPSEGSTLIISNHSGMIPMDAAMIVASVLIEGEQPRLVRSMVDKWAPTVPLVYQFFVRTGQVAGLYENAEALLERGEIVLIFPEGTRGTGKTYDMRYKLQRFTPGFVELAFKFKSPIVPTAVIGAEEQHMIFKDFRKLARTFNMPYFPVTLTFPWLGPLGIIPLPSKYRIFYGEPIRFFEQYEDDVLFDPEKIRHLMEEMRERIQGMIEEGLKKRRAPFF